MKMNDWTKMLRGDMSGLKKEKKEVTIPENRVYRLQWANGQRTSLVDHDEAVRRVNGFMNRIGWDWVKVINEDTKQTQVVYEPTSSSNRGFLHLKNLNKNMLLELGVVRQGFSSDWKKYKPLAKKKLEKMGFKVKEVSGINDLEISGGDLSKLHTNYISTHGSGNKDFVSASEFEAITKIK